MALHSAVFRERLREVRRIKGWTQQQLSEALADLGVRLESTTINRLEKGSRGVSVDEVIGIAAALGVSPLHLLVPLEDGETVDVTPNLTVSAADARAWLRGQRPLRDTDDDKIFYTQAPETDWDAIAPRVAHRFANREEYEQTRARWEREIVRAFIRGAGGEIVEAPPKEESE